MPIGYADGISRALTNNCDVLIGGGRYPLVGTVSMDNITVDARPRAAVASGRATATILIGRDGARAPDVEEVANRIGHDRLRGAVRDLGARVRAATTGTAVACAVSRSALDALAADHRAPAWLVGGAVRDRLLGRRTADYDIVVARSDGVEARRRARARPRCGRRMRSSSRRRSAPGGWSPTTAAGSWT